MQTIIELAAMGNVVGKIVMPKCNDNDLLQITNELIDEAERSEAMTAENAAAFRDDIDDCDITLAFDRKTLAIVAMIAALHSALLDHLSD